MKSHTCKIYYYFSVHFNEISENKKIKIIIKLKNQNGTHHDYWKVFLKNNT